MIEEAFSNSRITNFDEYEFSPVSIDEDLFHFLNDLIDNSHLFPSRSGVDYQRLIFSLVTKWNENKKGLLEIIAELTCRLTRGHYFINGNKRTALITMNKFLNSCGFSLRNLEKKIIKIEYVRRSEKNYF